MRFFFSPQINPILRPGSALGRWSFGKFLILLGTCSMGLILIFSFLSIYNAVSTYLGEAFSRNAQTRALAQADAISRLLDEALLELEYLSRSPLSVDAVIAHFNNKSAQERNRYGEMAFWGTSAAEHFVLVNTGDAFVSLPPEQHATTGSGIFAHIGKDAATRRAVDAGEPVEVVYTALPSTEGLRNVSMHVVRLTLPVVSPENQYRGQLVLSVNLLGVRDILSLYTSAQSPLYLVPQSNERKRSFVFDLEGWLLFESESVDDQGGGLTVDKLRVGLQGDVGRPGFKGAFRPAYFYQPYWTIVTDVQAGHAGQLITSTFFSQPEKEDQAVFLSYAPIVFHGNNNKIMGGIGCFDSSYIFLQAKKDIYDLFFGIFWISIAIFMIILFFIGRSIGKNIENIYNKIESKINGDDQTPIDIYSSYAEINLFQKSINILLLRLYMARREILQIYEVDREDRMRNKVNLDAIIDESAVLNKEIIATPLHGIVGGSIAIVQLRQQIHKAASVLADVLIIGETGTGKELTAAAVHAMSYRAKGPFISISCGALDENLLMDALFGHVKGAYSEAHSDRKGAFLAASGGTLLLDEIGNASFKVQQALLRALSVRRIVPLGSDQEVAFDARIIAVTNVDLRQSAEASEHSFRDDLYYRLAVLTINTPPLRNRKEDLPVLIRYFLETNCRQTGRAVVGVSRGALDKMLCYDWPGNVRELEHCLIRSLAFVDGDLLLAEHILFNEFVLDRQDNQGVFNGEYAAQSSRQEDAASCQFPLGQLEGLNERQLAVWPLILRQGSISRSEYQQALDHTISVRTAQYDLYDFVSRGVLVKSGRGPSCRYRLVS